MSGARTLNLRVGHQIWFLLRRSFCCWRTRAMVSELRATPGYNALLDTRSPHPTSARHYVLLAPLNGTAVLQRANGKSFLQNHTGRLVPEDIDQHKEEPYPPWPEFFLSSVSE